MLYALSDNILDFKWGFLSVHMDQSELETLWKLKTQLLPLIISIQVPLIHTRCLFRLMQRTKLHLFKPTLNSSSVHIEKHSLVHQLEVGALLTFSIRVMHLSIVFNIFFYPSDRRPKVERGRQGWVWAFSEQTHLFQPAAVGTPGPCRMELELIGIPSNLPFNQKILTQGSWKSKNQWDYVCKDCPSSGQLHIYICAMKSKLKIPEWHARPLRLINQ